MRFNFIQIAVTLFFIYFSTLLSSSSSILLNCSFQQFLEQNFILKQFTIFLAIFVFTYIITSYRIADDQTELFTNNQPIEKNKGAFKILKYLLFTLIIHVVFILSTLNEGIYLFIVLVSFLCITFIEVFTNNVNNSIYREIFSYYYINSKQKQIIKNKLNDKITNETDEKDFNTIVLNHNISFIWLCVIIIILIIGAISYYTNIRKIHTKNWNWVQFIFGNNYCKLSGYLKSNV